MSLSGFRDYIAPTYAGDFGHYAPAFAGFTVLLLIGVATLVLRRAQKNVRNVGMAFAISSLIGLIVYWLRYEGALYLDLNFWIWLVYIVLAGSIIWALIIHTVTLPRQKEQATKQHIKSKYLPSRKHV